jgi:hypothetical protein
MKRSTRGDLKSAFMGSAGWLFADLLLALAMLFLIANTVSLPKPPIILKPKPDPTAIPPPRLEQNYHRFSITIDPNRLSSQDPGERDAVIQQIKVQTFLQNRNAGLVIVYGGAPTTSDIPTAQGSANTIYDILIGLGKHDPTFARVVRYDPLYLLGYSKTAATLDIFLFAQGN